MINNVVTVRGKENLIRVLTALTTKRRLLATIKFEEFTYATTDENNIPFEINSVDSTWSEYGHHYDGREEANEVYFELFGPTAVADLILGTTSLVGKYSYVVMADGVTQHKEAEDICFTVIVVDKNKNLGIIDYNDDMLYNVEINKDDEDNDDLVDNWLEG